MLGHREEGEGGHGWESDGWMDGWMVVVETQKRLHGEKVDGWMVMEGGEG